VRQEVSWWVIAARYGSCLALEEERDWCNEDTNYLAEGGGYLNRCEVMLAEGGEEGASRVGFCDVEFFGSEEATGARDGGHVGKAGWRQSRGWDLPFRRYARGNVGELAVTNGLPLRLVHSW